MVGNVAFSNAIYRAADHDPPIDILFHRFAHLHTSCTKKQRIDAMESAKTRDDHVSNDLPLITMSSVTRTAPATSSVTITTTPPTTTTTSSTTTIASESLDIETDNEQRIYSDAFLNRCKELASYNDSVCDEEDYATTWFSRVRRRCSNIRDWLPNMCSCMETGTTFLNQSTGHYQRLSPKRNLLEFIRSMNRIRTSEGFSRQANDSEEDEEQMEELRFYCDDDTCYDIFVEKNLRVVDLCELLKAKRSKIGIDWSIVETWSDLGIERTLEDHEYVLAVYKEIKTIPVKRAQKFVFRQDYLKYQFFYDSGQFLSTEMINVSAVFAEDWDTLAEAETALRNYLEDEGIECPEVFGLAWIQNGRLNVWRRIHLLLRDRKLYQAKKVKSKQAFPFAHLTDYMVYKIANARKRYRAPFPWGICLRPTGNARVKSTESAGEAGFKVIAFHSEKSRACWLTAMRLAKYGKQLRENYRAFKNKQCEQTDGPKDRYVNYNVSNESVRSRVAMDFTGSVGRIVEDPKEAKNIAESEGVNWRRTWRPFSRPPPGCAVVRLHGLDDGIHVLQPWFHRGLKRDIAAAIVRDHGSVDGVFLVRESKSNLGAYVLTYKYSEKVFHAQIQPVFDERCNCWLYTLDKGITRFYDLLQLIEFYQLNAGCLPTRLTHYVQNGVPEMLPLPVPMSFPHSDDGDGSPSPIELEQRFDGNAIDAAGHKSI
ncbi:PREDICTED: growth factor receptor-bound protein 14-like isoform X2 [Eufriesea mexicana]|uniref:growth factor receptor-bound protein 14-like isoform X2 n=1 Tax=Eufriesea mexicana TaxID=516756 RepID=UPI00083BFA30|nr:PREDICTED: growth factor receptor-bound protein 14-like isoform X2 [Eufriesea mexicana]